ncbi:hypothetical protein BGZ76_003112 [Entomortierella beljakovae]|nr:hypothetical protein BGZ76_003112 [Entomortierella beljakovae]
MKLSLLLTITLLTASLFIRSADAVLGPTLGISYVYAMLKSIIEDFQNILGDNSNDKTIIVIGVGHDLTGNTGKGGPPPYIFINALGGERVTDYVLGYPLIEAGTEKVFKTSTSRLSQHQYLSIAASDDDSNNSANNPMCISFIAIAGADTKTGQYVVNAEVLLGMDPSLPWAYTGEYRNARMPSNSCRTAKTKEKCFWMSNHINGDNPHIQRIEILDIPAFIDLAGNPVPQIPTANILKVTRSDIAAPALKRRDTTQLATSVMVGSYSATDACTSVGYTGASILSTTEGLFCDAATKTLYVECSDGTSDDCYRVTGDTVTVGSASARILPAKPRKYTSRDRLAKRGMSPQCNPGVGLPSIPMNGKMSYNDFLDGDGEYRMAVVDNGGLVVYKYTSERLPIEDPFWALLSKKGLDNYSAKLTNSGQLCTVNPGNVVGACYGPKSTLNQPYVLTLDNRGYLTVKNGATVIWTTDPTGLNDLKDIEGVALTTTNSLKSGRVQNAGFIFKSPGGKTSLDVNKKGYMCLYNANGYNTWCMDTPVQSGYAYSISLASQGQICGTWYLSGKQPVAKCTGGGFPVDVYYMVMKDDGFLSVYNSAEQVMYRRGGYQSFTDGSVMRVGTRAATMDIRSPDDKHDMFASNDGKIVICDTKTWVCKTILQVAHTAGNTYTMQLGSDGNLCLRTAGGKSDCIRGTALPKDDYKLQIVNGGKVYIWGTDGEYYWNDKF